MCTNKLYVCSLNYHGNIILDGLPSAISLKWFMSTELTLIDTACQLKTSLQSQMMYAHCHWLRRHLTIIDSLSTLSQVVLSNYVHPPLGRWGEHPDLLWFPVTQMCVSVHICARLFTQYFLQFFTNDFQIFRYGDHEQDIELFNFSWPWLNFQGHRAHYVSKLTLVTQYFL